jgi:hypothetical protein
MRGPNCVGGKFRGVEGSSIQSGGFAMSGLPLRGRHWAIAFEALCALAIIVAAGTTLAASIRAGYLVQPFIYITDDTFMDWFNTAWWGAHDEGAGAYEVWGSIYPPISFVFLKLTTLQHCYVTDSLHARDCDWLGRVVMYSTFFLNIILVAVTYWRWDRVTAPFRVIAIGLGFPALYGLERGNLIMICFTFFFLAHAPLLRSARLKWLAAAISINFKVYLIATLAASFARRRWLSMEAIAILTMLVYAFTYALYGKGMPNEIITNIISFADIAKLNSWQDVYAATSLNSLDRLLRDNALALRYIDSDIVEWTLFILPKVVLLGQLSCVAAILATWLRPSSAPSTRLIAISVTLAIMTSEASGYTYMLVIAFVFFEPWKGKLRITALVLAYMLSLTTDYVFAYVLQQNQYSYWAGYNVHSQFGVALGHYVRPFGLIFMTGALNWLTITNCLRTLRKDLAAGRPIFTPVQRVSNQT